MDFHYTLPVTRSTQKHLAFLNAIAYLMCFEQDHRCAVALVQLPEQSTLYYAHKEAEDSIMQLILKLCRIWCTKEITLGTVSTALGKVLLPFHRALMHKRLIEMQKYHRHLLRNAHGSSHLEKIARMLHDSHSVWNDEEIIYTSFQCFCFTQGTENFESTKSLLGSYLAHSLQRIGHFYGALYTVERRLKRESSRAIIRVIDLQRIVMNDRSHVHPELLIVKQLLAAYPYVKTMTLGIYGYTCLLCHQYLTVFEKVTGIKVRYSGYVHGFYRSWCEPGLLSIEKKMIEYLDSEVQEVDNC